MVIKIVRGTAKENKLTNHGVSVRLVMNISIKHKAVSAKGVSTAISLAIW